MCQYPMPYRYTSCPTVTLLASQAVSLGRWFTACIVQMAAVLRLPLWTLYSRVGWLVGCFLGVEFVGCGAFGLSNRLIFTARWSLAVRPLSPSPTRGPDCRLPCSRPQRRRPTTGCPCFLCPVPNRVNSGGPRPGWGPALEALRVVSPTRTVTDM